MSRRETEHRFKTLAEHAKDSICELSADGRFLYGSNRGHDSLAAFRINAAVLAASSTLCQKAL